MKISKHHLNSLIVFLVILTGILVSAGYCIITFYVPWRNQEGFYYRYDEMILSSNEDYLGVIDTEKERVFITDSFGREISGVDIKEECPSQIALGSNSYFLLYQWENENGAGKIVQYDYQSNKLKECMVSDIATIACRNKYLFIGEWKHEEEDADYYFLPFYKGFYANKYIDEEQFGDQLKNLSADQQGCCLIGDIKMYYHEEGYFSTEPVWEDYAGTSIGDSGYIEGGQKPSCRVCEYQSGDEIYGVCNVLKKDIPTLPVESSDVLRSYCYKIVRESDKMEIMAQTDSR